MTLEVKQESGGKVLEVHISGKLVKEDYERFVPVVEGLIQQFGKVNVLVSMHDFHGWTAGALWEDIKFDTKHFGWRLSARRSGSKAWPRSAGRSPPPRFATSTAKMKPPRRLGSKPPSSPTTRACRRVIWHRRTRRFLEFVWAEDASKRSHFSAVAVILLSMDRVGLACAAPVHAPQSPT
jgi:hypothetical protein